MYEIREVHSNAHSTASFAKGKVLQQKGDIIKLSSHNIPSSVLNKMLNSVFKWG